jgi:hypothetical protein
VALRRPEHPERVAIVAVVVVIVANLAYFGTRNEVRGTAAPERPRAIVQLTPQEHDHVLPQTSIVADLDPRYVAQLAVDGKPIPDDQLVIVKDFYELRFEPAPEHDIAQFAPGSHFATIEYWPKTKTFEQAKAERLVSTYTWNFSVG